MNSIYNSLLIVWNKIKENTRDDKSLIFLILLCCSIPFSLGLNNFFLVLFIVTTLFFSYSKKIKLDIPILLPVFLFVLMVCSYLWSIDQQLTIKAIPKEISLFLIPLTFLIKKQVKLNQINLTFNFFSWTLVIFASFLMCRAIIRYIITNDSRVFFYHGNYENDFGLVSKTLNAIHVSVFAATAYFLILTKKIKSKLDFFGLSVLILFVVLLSSKNIILVFILLNLIYFFYYSRESNKKRLRIVVIILSVIIAIFSFGKIKERFQIELQTNTNKSLSPNVVSNIPKGVHYVSVYEAWNKEKFSPNDFFPGTAFRVYQLRLFLEFLAEEDILFKGFGLNASYKKIEEKGVKYGVFLGDESHEGYQKKNFHNQYLQIFSELGIFGLIILLLILFFLVKNSIQNKDFSQFAFAVLMISLFLTESFLWRQRGIVFFSTFYSMFWFKNGIKQNL